MAKKNNGRLLFTIKNLLTAYIQRYSDLKQLATLEAQLAGQTFVTLIVLIVAMFFLLISTWLSLLVVLFFGLRWLDLSPFLSAFSILALNVLVLVSLYFYMSSIKKNLYFPATRRQLSRLRRGM